MYVVHKHADKTPAHIKHKQTSKEQQSGMDSLLLGAKVQLEGPGLVLAKGVPVMYKVLL